MYNLIYINTHDTGRMISPYGFDVPTPHLLELAKQSALFTNAYCCGPTCSPSRAAMLTGQYPHQNGMLGLAQRGFSLENPKHHLAGYLSSQGYRTAISGIQHETGWYLDIDINKLNSLGYGEILTAPSGKYEKTQLCEWDNCNAKAAARWIASLDAKRPFMLTYGLHSTHRPYPVELADTVDARYVHSSLGTVNDSRARKDEAQFMTSAHYADDNIEIVLDAVKQKGLWGNTVIMYTTDHGVALPFHKCTLSDKGIGVGLMIHHPENMKGTVCDALVSQLDIFPTLCDLIGVPKPEWLEGESFSDYFLCGKNPERKAIFAEINFHTSYEPARCVRTERYKYIRYFDSEWDRYNLSNIDESLPKDIALENGLREKKKPLEALYDCVFDPDESCNLAGDEGYRQLLVQLRDSLEEHMKKTSDPLLIGELPVLPHYKVNKRECMLASSSDMNDYDDRGTR